MGKNDLNIDIEGNIIDEELEYQRLIELSFLRGQKVVLQNIIKSNNKVYSKNNTLILEGIKIAYNKMTILINESIGHIELAESINNNEIARGTG
ncbi:MAG: hypothetical protein HQL29_06545 [Candidatus Omnitrophica bacterium]|nr:hypothetical protein [Candidatus Omnitrophota bacterium]